MSEPARAVDAVVKPAAKLPPSAVELRRARARRLGLRFAIFVGLPTLLAIVYYGALASRQYDASAVIAVAQHQGPDDDVKSRSAAYQRDARLLRDYLRSRGLLEQLAAEHGLLRHYQDPAIDWWSRLAADAGGDEAHAYVQDKLGVTVDGQSSALAVRVRAFAPAQAQALLTAMVAAAGDWVRTLSERSRIELIEPAELEVARARERLVSARHALLAVTGGAEPTAEQLADPVVMEHELAELALAGTLEALQGARLDAARAQRHLVIIDAPSRPDQAARPRVLWDVATVLVTSLVLVSVLSLLGAAVREHANF